jgi:hypothetical protein
MREYCLHFTSNTLSYLSMLFTCLNTGPDIRCDDLLISHRFDRRASRKVYRSGTLALRLWPVHTPSPKADLLPHSQAACTAMLTLYPVFDHRCPLVADSSRPVPPN